jgi:hypothetical protein
VTLREWVEAELGRVGLADDDRSRAAQATHHLTVDARGRESAGAAKRGWLADDVDVVLDCNRYSEERQPLATPQSLIGSLCSRTRRFCTDDTEGVERGLGCLDAGERSLDQCG